MGDFLLQHLEPLLPLPADHAHLHYNPHLRHCLLIISQWGGSKLKITFTNKYKR